MRLIVAILLALGLFEAHAKGPFQIVSSLHGFSFSIGSFNQHFGGQLIHLWRKRSSSSSRWKLKEYKGGGYYQIISQENGKCLDLATPKDFESSNIIVWDCHPGDNQKWKVIKGIGGEFFYLQNLASGGCLAPLGKGTLVLGLPVTQKTCKETLEFQWRFMEDQLQPLSKKNEISSACNRVDLLREKWGGKLRQIPLYDQGNTNICYAYAAVEIFDYWRETNGLRITKNIALSSPLYAALLSKIYLQAKGRSLVNFNSLDFGLPQDVLLAIKEYGMCRMDIIQKSIQKFSKSKALDSASFIQATSNMLSFFRSNPSETYFPKCPESAMLQGNCPKFDKIFEVLRPYILKGNFLQFLVNIFGECLNKIESQYLVSSKIPSPSSIHFNPKPLIQGQNVKMLLNRKNPQPVGIGYCSKVLVDQGYRGISKESGQIKNDCGPHASIIVGKRKRGGKCEFLVRNTYGAKCKSAWECKYDLTGQGVGIWVDEERLMENTLQLFYLNPKEK